MMLSVIKATGEDRIGNWKLSDFGMTSVHIPPDRIQSSSLGSKTSGGILKKFTVQHTSGKLLHVKSGSYDGFLFDVKEPISERISFEVAIKLGFNVARYMLWVIDKSLFDKVESSYGESDSSPLEKVSQRNSKSFRINLWNNGKVLVSVSEHFVPEDGSFFSFDSAIPLKERYELYEELCSRGPEIKRAIDQMIAFDFIIGNTDRHTKNFGFIRSEEDSEVLAPLYDHGHALLSQLDEETLEDLDTDALDIAMGKGLGHLGTAFSWIDLKSLDVINTDIAAVDLCSIVNGYQGILSNTRIRLINTMIETRWEYVKGKILSSI